MEGIKALYHVMRADRRKERYEMILEPFQALVQLSLLSFCPVGSRLAISNNLLSIQTPSFATSITRSYYQDCRDDLVYLFGVIIRYHKFYSYMIKEGSELSKLYYLLINLGKKGLEKIVQTYTNSGHGTLIQQLKMYNAMLDHPDSYTEKFECKEERQDISHNDIDGIFIQIRELYEAQHMYIVLSIFELMQANPSDYKSYMIAINAAMEPSCTKIQKWVHQKIIL